MRGRVEYDGVAASYDRRYAVNDYRGVQALLARFVARRAHEASRDRADLLEVGCGTGHWLAALAADLRSCAGLDPSRGMLERAREAAPGALLVQGRAEALPYGDAAFDRVIVVNALHHVADRESFVREARRVLRPGGGFVTIGLDPHAGLDEWWIYEHFPGALAADSARYPAAGWIRDRLAAAGFVECETAVAQHWPVALPVERAIERGLLERTSTSQLLVIGDEEYDAGVARIRALEGDAHGPPMLRADLRVWATTAWVPM